MNIYQPMMFVGLGGTGCLIGAELERRLREELCGPDGRDLLGRIPGRGYLPYQLPSCVQFVYSDLNESDLTKIKEQVVPAAEHHAAAARTQRLTHDLVPRFNTYPEVALSLRTNAMPFVRDWLPPPSGEPRIAPLLRGAGQLPTVGRAALFETFRSGLAPAQRPITDAIGAISNSADELSRLGGRLGQTCDVFVAFSVAGGTGAGIFYDYLFLIGQAFQQSDYRAQIYPLVLMPSAFEEGVGGGRRARLNAGKALLDLFRLVDDQNGAAAGPELTSTGSAGSLGVLYPGQEKATTLLPSTVQTAFLFSGSYGVKRDDLHRSSVSLILSLVGTGTDDTRSAASSGAYQSFADDFINREVERVVPAASGIGLRGVSTSLVASMTTPVDDLADIVAARLLARAVDELAAPALGGAEDSERLMDGFLAAANLDALRAGRPPLFTDVDPVAGAEAVFAELRTRSQVMEQNLLALTNRLRRDMPDIAAAFDPQRGVEWLFSEVDLFRLGRVVLGDPRLADPVDREGVAGGLEILRRIPNPPRGIAESPPKLLDLAERRFRFGRLRWSDPKVQQLLHEQDLWYAWQARCAWNTAWGEQLGRWVRAFESVRGQLGAVLEAFAEHARGEPARFAQRTADLHRNRVGVTYLLPPHSDLDDFYREVLARLAARDHGGGRPTEGTIVTALLGADGWRPAWDAAPSGSAAIVAAIRERLKREIKRLFTQDAGIGVEPLLPSMASLLARAARRDTAGGQSDYVRQFEDKIHGLVPAGFTPQGTGDLKVLISYPAGAADAALERFLREQLRLPREQKIVVEFRPIRTESVVVVLFRTSMSITEVPELRQILRHWSDAVARPQPQDFLSWRQRLGHDNAWLVTTEEHRIRILHRLLCAMWNDNVTVLRGDEDSPDEIRVALGPEVDRVSMTLSLTPFESMSSWGSVLRAYEEWVLADDEKNRRDFCEHLMRTMPDGLDGRVRPPSAIFDQVYHLAAKQERDLQDLEPRRVSAAASSRLGHLRRIWGETFPAALHLPFENVELAARPTLAELFEVAQRRGRGEGAQSRSVSGPTRGDAVGTEEFRSW